MSFLTSAWFWLTLFGVAVTVLAIILYTARKPVEWWVWAILIAGIVLAVLGIVIGIVQREERYQVLKVERADYRNYLMAHQYQPVVHTTTVPINGGNVENVNAVSYNPSLYPESLQPYQG